MKKIMIVDDSSTIRNVIKNALIGSYEVCEADDGVNALKVIPGENPISLFLLDVNMPNMDGLTLLEEIRKLPEHTKTPIIMLTTETKDEFRDRAKKSGANGWVVKPVEADKLQEVVKHLIF
jgi:two-component system chemotaxis response regulator CheY